MPTEQTTARNPAADKINMATDTASLEIRPATESDVPVILSFIRKLAEYGDISDEVSATEDDIRAALFGPNPVAAAVFAWYGNQPAGFALYHYTFASFLGRPGIAIEDLYVENAHRSRGVGKALLVHLAKLAEGAWLRTARMGRPRLERASHGVLPRPRRRAHG